MADGRVEAMVVGEDSDVLGQGLADTIGAEPSVTTDEVLLEGAKKLSATASSQQFPVRLILQVIPFRAGRARYSADAYWRPQSVWSMALTSGRAATLATC